MRPSCCLRLAALLVKNEVELCRIHSSDVMPTEQRIRDGDCAASTVARDQELQQDDGRIGELEVLHAASGTQMRR
jgi:hypothetical protein